jgi:predicted transcriptional regulator
LKFVGCGRTYRSVYHPAFVAVIGLAPTPWNAGNRAMAKVRLNIEVSQELANTLDALANTEDTTKAEIVRRALSVMKAYQDQISRGRAHIGFVQNPDKLDAEILGILTAPVERGTRAG